MFVSDYETFETIRYSRVFSSVEQKSYVSKWFLAYNYSSPATAKNGFIAQIAVSGARAR